MFSFKGAWPALVTPFTADDRVNVAVLHELVDYFIARDAGGFYVCGSTSEGIFMSVEERQIVAETVLDRVNGRVPVIVHVGAVAATDATQLAAHAMQHGASGISSILPPLYDSTEGLLAYFRALYEAAPEIPLLPYLYGGPVDAVALMQTFMQIPSIAGTKYTGPNMHELRGIVELRAGNWTVFSGMDEQCLFAAIAGSSGNIGSTVNLFPGLYRAIHAHQQAGEFTAAYQLQLRANAVIKVLYATGKWSAALKTAMGMLGFDCGAPRLPRLPMTPAEQEKLRAQLEASDFRELAAM